MSETGDRVLADSSAAAKQFLSYFHQAIDCLAPISEPLGEDPSPSLRMLSAAAETLMQEIVQHMRWFRNQNHSSARDMGDLGLKLAGVATNDHVEPWTAWHQSLTVDDIKEKIVEASQVYGEEGLDRLFQLQEKIIKLHRETVLLGEENINAKLIQQDRDESRIEDREVFYDNIEVSVPEASADIVTLCLSIGLAVMKPIVNVFCHKKKRACSHEIQAGQAEAQIDKATLKVLKTQGDRFRSANLAISNSQKALQNMNDIMFNTLTEQVEETRPGQPINPLKLDFMRFKVGQIVMAQQDIEIQLDDFFDEVECPEHGLIKSPTTLRIKEFHDTTKNASQYLGSLLSMKQIIREKHRDNFVENITKIAKEFAEILDKVKNVFASWSRYAEQGASKTIFFKLKKEAAAVTGNFIPFDREVRKCIHEITRILEKKHDKSSGKWLQKWQKDGDRVLEGSKWEGRPLATILEAKKVVQKLEDITNAILKISNEVMLPLLECSGESVGHNLPTGERFGREALQAVPESTLDMIFATLSVESINLKGFGSKDSAHA